MAGLSGLVSAVKNLVKQSPENLSAVASAVKRLGVSDPNNPSAADFKVIWDAYLKNKSLDTEIFSTYVKSLSVPLKAMFDGFAQFSKDSSEVSKKTIHVIERAMDALEAELNRADISQDERQTALEHVLHLVAEARDESGRERAFRYRLAYGMLGTVVIVGGLALWIITGGRYQRLMEKGLTLVAKAA
ncbi:MAG: hypothetical protein ACYCXZ_03865 [Coriobacteriia bacterium]